MKGFSSTTVQSSASNLFLFSASIRYNCLTLMPSVCSALDTMVGMRRFRPTWQMSDIDRPRSRRIQLLRRSNQHSSGEALGVEEGYGLGSDPRMDSSIDMVIPIGQLWWCYLPYLARRKVTFFRRVRIPCKSFLAGTAILPP